ncbi:MAG: purine-nucleoside phosphorylase [Clostridia bacterium]|nr:purine-nucleoside phosphorylase [Clostridia bacterium]
MTAGQKERRPAVHTPTPHNSALRGDFAETVLMPGDPLRSRWIAQNFLQGAKLVNNVRGAEGYTGLYRGRRVSVMSSGMGQPSIGIHSYELFRFYGVESILRVGTCGAFAPSLHVRDVVLAMGACTDGNYAAQFELPGTFCPVADFGLLRAAADACEKTGVTFRVGTLLSSDVFYGETDHSEKWRGMGVLGVEMETAALYTNAARAGKRALSICTVSDSFVYPEENATAEERQSGFEQMVRVALSLA